MNIFFEQAIVYVMVTLDKAKVNKIYKIINFCGENDAILRRFLELGFSVGEKVKVLSTSLQKKVFLIEIRGYLLSVRASLLNKVEVES